MTLTCEGTRDCASFSHCSAVIRSTLTAFVVMVTAAPAQASVYAVEQQDGSWRVSQYNDNDPTVRVTPLDREKTIKVDRDVQQNDVTVKRYTLAGEARLAAYHKADREWLKRQARNGTLRSRGTHSFGRCVADLCLPEPGWEGRPPYPSMEEGRDFTYGFKTVTVKVDAPNPNYLKPRQPWYILSDRAKTPGGRWLIGTTVTMTKQEFNNYLLDLERRSP